MSVMKWRKLWSGLLKTLSGNYCKLETRLAFSSATATSLIPMYSRTSIDWRVSFTRWNKKPGLLNGGGQQRQAGNNTYVGGCERSQKIYGPGSGLLLATVWPESAQYGVEDYSILLSTVGY
jgi:hypothetical protein